MQPLSRLLLFSGLPFLISGCCIWPWEPFPSWERQIIQEQFVAKRVIKAFYQSHPHSIPVQIEKSVFMSRIQHYPTLYRFWISESDFVIYDSHGKSSDLKSWFPKTKIQTEQDAAANP